jgi:hypothetical protein
MEFSGSLMYVVRLISIIFMLLVFVMWDENSSATHPVSVDL